MYYYYIHHHTSHSYLSSLLIFTTHVNINYPHLPPKNLISGHGQYTVSSTLPPHMQISQEFICCSVLWVYSVSSKIWLLCFVVTFHCSTTWATCANLGGQVKDVLNQIFMFVQAFHNPSIGWPNMMSSHQLYNQTDSLVSVRVYLLLMLFYALFSSFKTDKSCYIHSSNSTTVGSHATSPKFAAMVDSTVSQWE